MKNRFTKISAAGKSLPKSAKDWVAVRDGLTNFIWPRRPILTHKVSQPDAVKAAKACKLLKKKWRLGEVEELFCIANRKRTDPAAYTDYFDLPADWFWTNTSAAGWPEAAWGVYFGYGHSYRYHRHYNGYVLPVCGASRQ